MPATDGRPAERPAGSVTATLAALAAVAAGAMLAIVLLAGCAGGRDGAGGVAGIDAPGGATSTGPGSDVPPATAVDTGAPAGVASGASGGSGGSGGSTGGAQNSGDVSVSGPLNPTPDHDVTQPNLIRPDSSLVKLHTLRWSKATPADGGRRVLVDFVLGAGPCDQLGRVGVAERADEIVITLWIGDPPGRDCTGPRPMLAMLARATVTLARPVGDRPIRDGAA